jgi:hypothetical protein
VTGPDTGAPDNRTDGAEPASERVEAGGDAATDDAGAPARRRRRRGRGGRGGSAGAATESAPASDPVAGD